MVLAILLVCAAIEGSVLVGETGIFGAVSMRDRVIAVASFQPGLFHAVQPLYPGQRAAMFLTYGLVHGGIAHLAVNMLTLAALGSTVVQSAGTAYFAVTYLAATVGGAIAYALIGPSYTPMVGASGALFGLIGALIGWEAARARAARTSIAPALRLVALLVVLNFVLWWAAEGRLAWQAHLGGALVGLAIGVARPPTRDGAA